MKRGYQPSEIYRCTVMAEPVTRGMQEHPRLATHFDTRPQELSLARRLQIPIIAAAVLTVFRVIGPTLRFEVVGWPNIDRVYASGRRCIYSFWHCCCVPSAWMWRNRGVVVLNSTNFDGQWTRRVVEKIGYGTAQGSSTRGGLRGLAALAQRIEEGHDAAFTIDGPRGPRLVAKPGPVLLARRTGAPIICFHFHAEHAHTFEKTWDKFELPHPFSRIVLLVGQPIEVPAEADRDEMARKQAEMQRMLNRTRRAAQSWFELSDDERKCERASWNA